ncbi:transmembrane protein, putative [Medicago truncatula]|uniref:Transmembrane protein, putative n=1 Tax=Medicago truncatula TaxID=3880 RepID=A0A072V2J7_MEDTR|nr:transmembrane protein, putative [Medicago truncatula]
MVVTTYLSGHGTIIGEFSELEKQQSRCRQAGTTIIRVRRILWPNFYRSLHMPIIVLASSLAIVMVLHLIRIKAEMQSEKVSHNFLVEKSSGESINNYHEP